MGILRRFPAFLALAAVMAWPAADIAAGGRPQPRVRPLPPPPPVISADTRLLIVAPHPDDEVLGAAGLIQKVHQAGGAVHVVYLTDGDGYPEGVRIEDRRKPHLSYVDFRGYGRRRQKEARAALAELGLPDTSATFLSFPDGGLCKLIRTYWSERRAAFRSPYTRLNRPPKSEWIVPDTEYRGEDLTQELASIIGEFQPTLILAPRKEDQHSDHCAAWYFTADALVDVQRVRPDYNPDLVNYIIHYNDWPFTDEGPVLPSPPYLGGGMSGWMKVPLAPEEVRAKRAALRKYQTQVHAMKWFLDGFVRSNEVFSRPAPAQTRVTLPLKRSPCCW
jgi:LmbE family N-acetylglucosaminyl deacetylase